MHSKGGQIFFIGGHLSNLSEKHPYSFAKRNENTLSLLTEYIDAMKNHQLPIFFILLFFFVENRIAADNITGKWSERYRFTHLTMNDGLPYNYVDDLLKDSQGFLWMATAGGGIARYDGNEFTLFNMTTTHVKLKSNFIKQLCEDNFGRLWIISEMGIDMLDIQTLRPVESLEKESKLDKLRNTSIHTIFRSKSGNIWLCSEKHIYKITFDDKGAIAHLAEICRLPKGEKIITLCEVNEYIWINYRNGVARIKESTSELTAPSPVVIPPPFQQDAEVQVIRQRENELWIGTIYGLYRYSLSTETVKHYAHTPGNPKSLSQNFITDIVETSEQTMLVATLKGINLYNTFTDDFEPINNETYTEYENPNFPNTLNNDFVNCMLADGDAIWIGTEVGGVSRMSRRTLFAQNFFHQPAVPGSLSKNPVNAVYVDEDNALWVGTVEGGLNRRSPGSNAFVHYTTEAPAHLSHNSVSCFTSDPTGKLWIGTWGGGFGWIDRKNTSNMAFHHIDQTGFSDVCRGLVGVICYDDLNQVVWVCSSNDICIYDLKTQSLSRPFKDTPLGGIKGCVGSLIDKDNNLWLGLSVGLCRIDLHTLRSPKIVYQLWNHKLDEPAFKQNPQISFITQSKDGSIWIGSNGYGFYQTKQDKNGEFQFKCFTADDGLVNNSVRGILEDVNGHIWLSTINGLSHFNPETNSFSNYTSKDGLADNQFYWNAAFAAPDGNLYLGGLAGLSVVKPIANLHDKKDTPLVFTHIRVADEEVTNTNQTIAMHERDKSIFIEFTVLDYDAPSHAAYSYRLKGFDNKWLKTSFKRRSATYTNLRPGNYTFELRYAPDGKQWLEKTTELTITVAPYFYKTSWFILLSLAILSFAICRIIIWRLRKFEKLQILLQTKVEERTHELEEQKKILAGQTTELSAQNELLKDRNEKITRQKEQLVEMSRKVEELTIDKLAFFTNITHEFRTPLTLIVGPIERALKLSYNPQVIEQLNFVERNSKYLLSLVNQLMDFRKVEANKMTIVRNAGNLLQYISELLLPFEAYAADKGVELRSYLRLPNRNVMFDQDAMHKVLTNLVSNALKFTPKGGRVSIYITSLSHGGGEEKLFLCIKDSGSGISEKEIDKVFNRFYQSQKEATHSIVGQSGTGIGLYLCKRIVELMGGTISVRNNRREGCAFRIILPLQYAETEVSDQLQEVIEPTVGKQTAGKKSKLTFLIVEDNKDMRDYIRSILSEYYHVIEASQGEEALSVLESQNIDFIISDLMMPVMDGMELSRKVKANFSTSHIPFLMLTAKTSDESRIEGFKTGIDEYLLKPFDDTLLLARIANILENRKRLQQKFSQRMEVEVLDIEEDSSDKKFLNRVMQLVKENYTNPDYSVSDFTDDMGVSKSLMYKKILDLTGQSAGLFLRNYRLNVARELINKNKITQNLTVSEIAYKVGFNDPKYFSRCFAKHFNMTPSGLMEGEEEAG